MDKHKEPHLEIDGKRVEIGQEVKTRKGDKYSVDTITLPHKSSSTGFVTIKDHANGSLHTYYPSVIGAVWVGRTDQ